MPVSSARAAAFDVLVQVERERAYAAELLHSARLQKLNAADHGLMTEVVMGVLRWRSLLDDQIAPRVARPLDKLDLEVLTALRMAAYQLMFLSRVPAHAAVDESVELVKRARKRSAVPLVNAVLRKLAPVLARGGRAAEGRDVVHSAEEMARRFAHPPWLVARWMAAFGVNVAHAVCASNQQVPENTVRLATPATEAELQEGGVTLSPGLLLAQARRVVRGDVSQTRAFREGRVAIQDEASQLVALLVGQGENILDCCAAPGGKTRILAELNPRATIVAAELHRHRARLLRKLAPANNVAVITADATMLPTQKFFDRVLADVPCSGTGTLARNPEIKWRLLPQDLADLHGRQTAILKSALQHVAKGGRLVYSTCSLEKQENEEVVEGALAADASLRLLDVRPELQRLRSEGTLTWDNINSLAQGPYLRTFPGIHPCEGFFAALLEKN